MAKIDIVDFHPTFSDKIFFDTNIWILLYGSIANYQKKDQEKYSRLLSLLIERDRGLYINSLVLSEFTNVLIRQEFNSWRSKNSNIGKSFKKDFLETTAYKNQRDFVIAMQNKILNLPIIEKVSDNFNAASIKNIQDYFQKVDFNDALIISQSVRGDFKVVTNDRDMFNFTDQVDIISAI